MARGTANGEPVVSQAQTPEYDEGYDRIFGKDRKPVRGRWVMTPQGLVPADQYQAPEPEIAAHAGILSGRFYENQKALDGSDIGSRKKHRDYMRAHGLAPADDFSPGYYERIRRNRELEARKAKRERIERKFWEIQNDRTKKGL